VNLVLFNGSGWVGGGKQRGTVLKGGGGKWRRPLGGGQGKRVGRRELGKGLGTNGQRGKREFPHEGLFPFRRDSGQLPLRGTASLPGGDGGRKVGGSHQGRGAATWWGPGRDPHKPVTGLEGKGGVGAPEKTRAGRGAGRFPPPPGVGFVGRGREGAHTGPPLFRVKVT